MDRQAVECHSGYAYPDRPAALWWQGQRFEIEAIEARWRTPEGVGFRVRVSAPRADTHQTFELFYSETEDAWRVTAI